MTGLDNAPSAHPVPYVAPRRPRTAPGEFTVGAVLWAGLALYSISQGFANDRAPLVILGATGVAAMVVGVIWPIVVIRRVLVALQGPTDAVAGSRMRFTVELRGRGANLAVRMLDPVGEWMYAEAPSVGEVGMIAPRRGVIERVRIEVKCGGPMNIFVRHRQVLIRLDAPLYVAPRVILHDVGDDVEATDAGSVVVATAQATDSVRSTRPYVAGDAPRLVHWASTARTGEIVVREFDPPAPTGVAIIVDFRGGGDLEVETAASKASGAARDLLQRGIPCLLVTCGTAPTVIHDHRTIDRILAAALVGDPGPVPSGWAQTEVRP